MKVAVAYNPATGEALATLAIELPSGGALTLSARTDIRDVLRTLRDAGVELQQLGAMHDSGCLYTAARGHARSAALAKLGALCDDMLRGKLGDEQLGATKSSVTKMGRGGKRIYAKYVAKAREQGIEPEPWAKLWKQMSPKMRKMVRFMDGMNGIGIDDVAKGALNVAKVALPVASAVVPALAPLALAANVAAPIKAAASAANIIRKAAKSPAAKQVVAIAEKHAKAEKRAGRQLPVPAPLADKGPVEKATYRYLVTVARAAQ